MNARIIIVFSGLIFLWGLVILRAGYLQFLPNDKLKAYESRQFNTVVNLPSRRGSIVDRSHQELAMSTQAFSLYADPKLITNPKKVARQLAQVIGQPYNQIFPKIKDKNKRFVWLQRLLSEQQKEQIQGWKIKGLGFVTEWKRVYPNESLLAQTIGFLGSEGQGLEGLEKFYDQELRGENRKVSTRRDARGRPLIQDGTLFSESPEGKVIQLTIDNDTQYTLENELRKTLVKFEADSAVGIVLDAKTSAIRAVASLPSLDLNRMNLQNANAALKNRALTDSFEPGSTIKTFLIAAALKDNLIQPNSKIDCENGRFQIGKRIIREADTSHNFGILTVQEVLAKSSNIGTAKIAFDMGSERLRQHLLDFGFGSRSGIDLPGENKGIILPLPWHQHLLANISFGQGMTANALQVANAYAVLANGGELKKPYIVESIIDTENNEIKKMEPQTVRRVLTEDQAMKMRMLLVGVTGDKGTAINARVPGYVVGGKTGTAQKVNPNGRGYLKNAYISSFAGLIPANNPEFVIYIAVDNPKKGYYGSQVAAPVFARVASYLVRKNGVSPQILSEQNIINPTIAKQLVTQSHKQVAAQKITDAQITKDLKILPDLSGSTMREVLRTFQGTQHSVKIIGSGTVIDTSPPPGSVLNGDEDITIQFKEQL